FEDCGYGRVKIQTDRLNTRSQAAIAKLGAQREGVLRRDRKREDGTFRDTVVFSVLADEWPAVRAGLESAWVSGKTPHICRPRGSGPGDNAGRHPHATRVQRRPGGRSGPAGHRPGRRARYPVSPAGG
ncbi:MAG TPA: GNAT family protein, partial [Streptosporangiaceae bacterium]|nr:GNAT family protein [Streptosporangiaceae bacterium]